MTGGTNSSDFPTTAGAFDTTHNGSDDFFVTNLNSTGSALVYSTFLGGNSAEGYWGDIAVDDSGNAYVTGETNSSDFPTTAGAFDTTYNDSADVFVVKLDFTGSVLDYSTFLGGIHEDMGYDIAVDGSGNAYVTGVTESSDFPTTAGVFDTTHNGGVDAFVAKLGLGDITPPEAIDDLTVQLDSGVKSSSGNMYLSWFEPYDNVGVTCYVVYRSTSAGAIGDSLVGTTDTTYLDVGAAGDTLANYFYVVKAVDAVGNKSSESNQVGEFDMGLINGTKASIKQVRQESQVPARW